MACALDPADVEEAVRRACRLDVTALKPGNVSIDAPGHGMSATDFLVSARVVAPLLAAPRATVGERILGSIEATMDAVGCNTNLGIVLLAAPLAHAALGGASRGGLRIRLGAVLEALTLADARQVFVAIRRARPAGLGHSEAQDVHGEPTMDLRAVMGLAAARDRIAFQYVHNFEDVFLHGLPALRAYTERGWSPEWAATGCYLQFLARLPDSHIARKHGRAAAGEVMQRAAEVERTIKACEDRQAHRSMLNALDRDLKALGVNPGTSADLTVASLMALFLEARLGGRKK